MGILAIPIGNMVSCHVLVYDVENALEGCTMKSVKNEKDHQRKLIFDYDNFLSKSSQQRYYELKREVKIKLDKISDEINIAGSTEKEKKFNLLMHYKYMLEDFDAARKESRSMMNVTLSFIKDIVLIFTVVFAAFFSDIMPQQQFTIVYGLMIFIVAFFIIVGVASLYKEQIRNEREMAKEDRQKYLYCKFYYNELKKYIKEKDYGK